MHRPVTVIEPKENWFHLDWGELWRARELLYYFCWRDVKIRYKQTFLGVAWAILQPALLMVVFSLFFGRLNKVDHVSLPFPLFICAGILPWTFFATAMGNAANSVIGAERMISKIYFPRLLLPLSSVGAALVDFMISIGLLVVMLLWYDVAPAFTSVLLPLIVVLIAMTAAGLGTLLAALNVSYRDFRYIVPFLIQVGLFVTPSIYLLPEFISPGMERWLWWNPMHVLVGSFRAALLGAPIPWSQLVLASIFSCSLFVLALFYFHRVEGTFADNI
ncbi:MAG TPA: ABC transporter permease [Gemmatales bacterium]|nr:ABC transporter permease [Gemmatales bacterium]HMP15878.1 ABC transporter permease [Gemmatales bacterium]